MSVIEVAGMRKVTMMELVVHIKRLQMKNKYFVRMAIAQIVVNVAFIVHLVKNM